MSAPRFHTDDECILALREHGSVRKAAKALGIHPRNLFARKARWVKRGFAPEFDLTHPVADGQKLKGASTLYREDGTIAAQWVKSNEDLQRRKELMEAVISDLAKPITGVSRIVKAPKGADESIACAYVLGDPHIGAYAWADECGEDFDTSIASRDIVGASEIAVSDAPRAATGYLISVGDTLHADDRSNATPQHRNLLDVDTRYQRVIRIAVETLRQSVDRMLRKHKHVKVFMVPGNHDPDSSGWLALTLAAYYHADKRVEVEQSPDPYLYQRFGRNLIGLTHGDKAKMKDLPEIMAADRPRDWGETEFRMWWTGHIHHERVVEGRGCVVESFNTLAAADAWNHAQGFRSRRQTQRIDISAEIGPYNRRFVGIKEVRRATGRSS
jgi:hypothetical protein